MQRRGKKYGECDYETDIPGTKEEEAGGREKVDVAILGEDVRKRDLLFGSAHLLRQIDYCRDQDNHQASGHQQERSAKANPGEQHSAEEEAGPFKGVLGTGQECDPSEQCGFGIGRDQLLDCTFRTHLGQIFGDAGKGLGSHDVGHRKSCRPALVEQGQHH